MDLHKLKQANDIFEQLTRGNTADPLQQLNTYEDLDDEVLRLVKSLLKNHQQNSLYFNQQIKQMMPAGPACPFETGDQLGAYVLTEVIGQGGMATVFKARRTSSDSQKAVAIKVFSLADQSPQLHQRFLAEQHILASLSHPNIIDFHHGETTREGQSYLVMELLEQALPIDQYINQHQLNQEQVVRLIRQVAHGLMYAHNHLIIHRDVKPSNILVTPQGQVKLLDFGIAKLLSPGTQADPNQTILALTPHYASPEQIKAAQIDVTTDVFSLAAVAVFLLTGQQPFPANRLLNECQHDEQHAQKILKTNIHSGELRNVLNKALKQERDQRYQNMFAFDEDLAHFLSKKPVSASRDSWWYRLNRFASRRRALFASLVALMLTVIIAITGLGIQNQAIKAEIEKADAVKSFMLNAFQVTDPNISQGVDLSTRDLLKQAADKIHQNQNMGSDTQVELLNALANAHGNLGYYPEAIALLEEALEVDARHESSRALLAKYQFSAGQIKALKDWLMTFDESQFSMDRHQATIIRVRSNLLAQAGEYEQAMRQFERLKPLSKHPLDKANDQLLLAELHYLQGASERYIEILESLKKSLDLPATDVFNLKLNSDLVQYHDRVGQYAKALELTQQNIETYQFILGDEHPDLGQAYNALSVFQRLEGQLQAALESARKSQELYRKRYGESSEGLAQAYSNIGTALYYDDQHDAAIEALTVAADMLTGIFSPEHPETLNAQYNLATILNATGRSAEAVGILEHLYQIELETLGPTHRSPMYTQQSLALTLAGLERFDQAIGHARENIDMVISHHAKRPDFITQSRKTLGRVLFMAKQYREASQLFTEITNNWTEGNKNDLANIHHLNARALWHLARYPDSERHFNKWLRLLTEMHGETGEKTLSAMLEWATLIKDQNPTKSSALTHAVRQIITDNDLDYTDINHQLNTLNQH